MVSAEAIPHPPIYQGHRLPVDAHVSPSVRTLAGFRPRPRMAVSPAGFARRLCPAAQQLPVAHEIDIAAADQNPDALAWLMKSFRERGSGAQAAGRLHDDLHALGEELHGVD